MCTGSTYPPSRLHGFSPGMNWRCDWAYKGNWTIEVIRRCDSQKGFKVLPCRWVVERTFAWLGRCRRLAKDWTAII